MSTPDARTLLAALVEARGKPGFRYLQDLDPLWAQARAFLKERPAAADDDVAQAQALLDQFELESAR